MPIEVQIRTADMHRIAEAGVASHWLYKQSDSDLTDLQRKTHLWLQSLLEMQTRSDSSVEFLEHLKVDLFPDEVYVFTPKGRILSLSQGSTCVDFAYAVHTDIGNRCVAARINGELVPLRSELRNGDRVEIITTAHAKPNPAWLNYVVTGKARSSIRHFLKTMQYEESAQLGERLLNQAVLAIGGKEVVIDEAQWERYARDHGNRPRLEVLADIGLGKLLAIVVARQLLRLREQEGGSNRLPGTVVIRGSEGMALQFAKCCHPIPGDPIIGYVKKGQGLVVHTHDCPVARKMRGDPDKWLDVEWSPDTRKLFAVNIRMVVSNQRGVLAKLAAEIAEAGSNIDNVSLEPGDSSAYSNIHFTLQVNNRLHLAHLMRGLRRIPEVIRITRLKG
jgi:GTP pyrophosphokinase